MEKTKEKEFYESLEKKALAITEQAAIEDGEEGCVFRAAFTTTKDGGGVSFFETQIIDVWEDMSVLHINVIPEFIIKNECMDEVKEMVLQSNLYMPLGSMGILFNSNHVFWKLTVPIDQSKTADELASFTIELYEKLANEVGGLYDAVRSVAEGESSFADQVKAGRLVDQ